MMDTPARDRALNELKRQIAEQRARIDPRVLKRAQIAAERAQDEKENPQINKMVPYDREAAAEAVALFLRNCDNREIFEKRLLLLLRSRQH